MFAYVACQDLYEKITVTKVFRYSTAETFSKHNDNTVNLLLHYQILTENIFKMYRQIMTFVLDNFVLVVLKRNAVKQLERDCNSCDNAGCTIQ